MVSQENIDAQHTSKEYWIIMGGISFIALMLVRYALTQVAGRLTRIRENMRGWVRKIFGIMVILLIIFLGVMIIINIVGKQQQRTKHKKQVDQPANPGNQDD